MGLLLFFSIGAAAIAAAALVVTRGLTMHRVGWISTLGLMTAGSLALLEAPYLAAVEALVGAALVPALLLSSLRACARAAPESGAPPERIPGRRRALGAVIAGALFVLLVVVIRSSPTLRGPAFEREALPARDIAAVGESLLGTQVIGFEVVAALFLFSLVAAVRLARPDSRLETGREST